MGASGLGLFDNDASADWAAEFLEAPSTLLLSQAFRRVAACDGYIQVDECCAALAAAETVAAARGYPHQSPPEELLAYAGRSRATGSAELAISAVQVIDRLDRGCELRDLFEEASEPGAWQALVEELRSRLLAEPRRLDVAPRPRRKALKPGDVLEVTLESGSLGFARKLNRAELAIYDLHASSTPSVANILAAPIAFRVYFTGRFYCQTTLPDSEDEVDWRRIATSPLESALQTPILYFHEDLMTGRLRLRDGRETKYWADATYEQCVKLDRAQFWKPRQVEQRLRDHFAGRANAEFERRKPKAPQPNN